MHNFSIPSRQSAKGVAVLLFLSFIKFIKQAYILVIIFAFRFISDPSKFLGSLPYLGLAFFALLVYLLIFNYLKFKNFKFHIEGGQFILAEGILNKKNTAVSFDKIQNVNMKQNVLHQFLNVVQLDIDTAGDKATEISITALEKSKALALKKILLRSGKATQKTENKEQPKDKIRISTRSLFLTGISENHVKSFIFLAAACIGLFSDVEDVLKSMGQEELYQTIENDVLGFNPDGLVLLLIGVALVLMISILYSISSIFIKNYGLTIATKKNKVEVSKGFFNKISYSLNINRVQSVHYETNYLKRMLGLYNLKILQAMATEKSKKNIQIVGIQEDELRFVEKLLFAINPFTSGNKEKPHTYYRTQLLYRAAFVLLLVSCVGFIGFGSQFLLLLIVIIPIVIRLLFLKYQKSYYVLSRDFIILGSGSISTFTSIVESHKMQSVTIHQNFFQKRKKVADLNIFVASTKITLPCVEYDRAIKMYNYLLFHVESSNKDWI